MLTSRHKLVFSIIVIVLLSACASKPLQIKEINNIDVLGICLDFNSHVIAQDKLLYLDATEAFVTQHQQSVNRAWVLDTCKTGQPYQLTIHVQNTRYVEPSYQVFYVLLSAAGITYWYLGGDFAFFWLGFNTSNLEVSVSDVLRVGKKRAVYRQVYSSPYFKSEEGLRIHHMERYQETLRELIDEIEMQLGSKHKDTKTEVGLE